MKITAVETIQVAEYSTWSGSNCRPMRAWSGSRDLPQSGGDGRVYARDLRAVSPWATIRCRFERHALTSEAGNQFMGSPSRSVEVRWNSAVDLALWAVRQAADLPLWQLLGGLCRERIRIDNTCASAGYKRAARASGNSLLLGPDDRPPGGDSLDDLAGQHQRPAELARSLREDGITAMKIWPFDAYAIELGGRHIERTDLRRGVQIVEAIRQTSVTGSRA